MTAKSPRLLFSSDPVASKPKEWLVAGVLGAGEVSLFLAPPFVGKSSLAGDMAAKIGLGEQWFGHATTRAATLYVAQERALVTARRLRAFETYHEVRNLPVALLLDRLHMVDQSREAVALIVAAAKACEDRTGMAVGLITLDTVASLSPGCDENSSKDMGRFVDGVARIRDQTGAHISLVHHTPQDDPRKSRGHTSLPGMVDTVVVLAARGDRRTWSVTQANDLAEKPNEQTFQLQSVLLSRDEHGNPTTAPVVVPCEGRADSRAQAAPQKSVALRGDAKLGADTLRRLAAAGPITLGDFREALLAHESFQRKTKDARRKACQTVRETLIAAGVAAVNENLIQLVT